MEMVFPQHPLKIEEQEGQFRIWDMIRRKWVAHQPEEHVRQALVHYMVLDRNISVGRIGVEREILYNQMRKRFDVVVFDSFGKPFILCECKAPEVPLSQDTLNQIARYNVSIQAPHLLLTNGRSILFFSLNEQGKYQFQPSGWLEEKKKDER